MSTVPRHASRYELAHAIGVMSRMFQGAMVLALVSCMACKAGTICGPGTHEDQGVCLPDTSSQTTLTRAYQVAQRIWQLEAIDVANKAERLAADPALLTALKSANSGEAQSSARIGFARFASNERMGEVKPDILALVDAAGMIVAMNDVPSVVPRDWQTDRGKTILPALDAALEKRIAVSDVWENHGALLRVGVASVMDPDGRDGAIVGAVVIAYARTARDAQRDRALLGTEVAYFIGTSVAATSFVGNGGTDEDVVKGHVLAELFKRAPPEQATSINTLAIAGVDYLTAVVKAPRWSTKLLPETYPPAKAMILLLTPK